MIAKISLIAALLLMIALPLPKACAANRAATNPAPVFRRDHELLPSMVVAQEPADGAAENGNDNDNDSNSNDNSDDNNQNADSNQTDQQNPAGNDQAIPSQAPDGNEQDSTPQFDPAPQPQPANPYQ